MSLALLSRTVRPTSRLSANLRRPASLVNAYLACPTLSTCKVRMGAVAD